MTLSIVTTLYGSSAHVDEFCERAFRSAAGLTADVEMIFVDDASSDGSLARALAWHARDHRVRVVELSRHYGHYTALLAGLARARGDRIFLADVDLEEPPELLEPFWAAMEADAELDLVVGVQSRRRGGWWERVSGAAFYRALNLGTAPKVIANSLVARLMTKRCADAMLACAERSGSLDILCAIAGFRQLAVPAVKASSSATTYTLARKVNLATRALLHQHQGLPWLLIAAAVAMALVAAVSLAASRLDVASIWAVGALLMAALGIVGHYLALLLDQARQRPTIVRREHTRDR
jgi:putative glycosyltransferase